MPGLKLSTSFLVTWGILHISQFTFNVCTCIYTQCIVPIHVHLQLTLGSTCGVIFQPLIAIPSILISREMTSDSNSIGWQGPK